MISSTDNLRTLLEDLKSLGVIDRVFGWRRIEDLNFVAFSEFQTLTNEMKGIYAQNNQSQNYVRMLYADLESQKNQYSELKMEYDSLRNSTGSIYDVLITRERELSEIQESELRTGKRLIELEEESARLRAIIDKYLQMNREKENELNVLKSADLKNTQRITELVKESSKLRTAFDQFSQKLNQDDSIVGIPERTEAKNMVKSGYPALRNSQNPREKRVLLVEDDLNIAEVLADMLTGIGYTLSGVAVNSEEAMVMADENRPDVVLLDVHLEGEIDGIETAQKIKGLYGTPTIFITAHSDDETIQRIVMTDSEGFLMKPINPQELFANIEIALHKKHKMRAAAE